MIADPVIRPLATQSGQAAAQSVFVAAPAPASVPKIQENLRSARDFQRAKRHSALVKILRLALPLVAVALVIIFIAKVFLSFGPLTELSIDSAGIKDGKLVMSAPAMAGFDSKKRPYDVKAARASQQITNPTVVDLEEIEANLPMDKKASAKIMARAGTYDAKKETLVLREEVSIIGARGMDILLKDAQVDIKTGAMRSTQAVRVNTDNTTIDAGSVMVEQNGDRVVFSKGVSMTIKPGTMGKDAKQ